LGADVRLSLIIALAGFACGGTASSDQADTDTDSAVDTDTDSAVDTDTDSAVDTDSDTDSGVDTGNGPTSETVTYRIVDGVSLEADIRVPAGEGPFDAVILIHGGAFTVGDKASGPVRAWQALLPTNGFVTFNVNYRLGGDFETPPHFPGPLQDIKCAIQWLRSEQDRFGGIEKVFVLGGSAGGYFSSMLAVSGDVSDLNPLDCPEGSNAVDGAISFYGIHDFVALAASSHRDVEDGLVEPEAAYVGSRCRPPEALCEVASPLTYLTASAPRFFLAHSTDDGSIPVSQSRNFNGSLKALGVESTYVEVHGMGHGWFGSFSKPRVAEVRDEILQWLRE
jgi:acetyl esterase/lipase